MSRRRPGPKKDRPAINQRTREATRLLAILPGYLRCEEVATAVLAYADGDNRPFVSLPEKTKNDFKEMALGLMTGAYPNMEATLRILEMIETRPMGYERLDDNTAKVIALLDGVLECMLHPG